MIAILESPEFRQRAQPINVETYHWMLEQGMLPQRAELIRGVIVEKMPKSTLHEYLASEFQDRLNAMLGDGWRVRKEGPLTFKDSEPEPDISVVRGRNADFIAGHPRTAALVVEIAVTSEASDREMVSAYAEAGVEECWLVLAKARVIEVYTSPVNGTYAKRHTLGVSDTLVSTALPGVSLEIRNFFPPLP
jgi:Uma2 family endonuclease